MSFTILLNLSFCFG